MKPIDYIIIAVIVLIVAAISVYIIRKKLKGEKVGCGCGCQSCPHAGACGGGKTTEENCDCGETKKEEHEENEHDQTV
ncbi:MAG: hypothetical protein IJY21_01880 [Clostridia bacterium]|nr:hypothetical protein [Clostridia bacterium]